MPEKHIWDRWLAAASVAQDALNVLKEIQDEYQALFDDMSEAKQEGERGLRICAITEVDIDGAISTVDDAANAEKP